jgi:hypothetical protein
MVHIKLDTISAWIELERPTCPKPYTLRTWIKLEMARPTFVAPRVWLNPTLNRHNATTRMAPKKSHQKATKPQMGLLSVEQGQVMLVQADNILLQQQTAVSALIGYCHL